ncbi:XkdX family protein [Paraclostridium sordellii]|uniref:XkdX family protein n=1 Tax=Paraclostridium sordellii TaxID=1505 RepID=UPI0005E96C2A|nr:XkdX family protein [Paeniclostridium sordellii]MDU6247293.1 XkdX family protein [Paeniclostridium sordellii]MRZ79657.1 XkdX family protein [Paeniclostridium sordellii]MSB57735.1 XkdX family protein [Paeniclostridium sordellii]MVO70969.1 XkdX family protein [Paeniclostridium sordellii]CEO27199.1 phage protein [[Clostridium] sordellii] [Paeniclostridium sordellii]
MNYYSLVKRYYNYIKFDGTRMYSKKQVAKFVEYGKITKKQYTEITNEDYSKDADYSQIQNKL